MGDQYDVVIRLSPKAGREADPIKLGRVLMVTLDDFGTLTIEAIGTIRSFQRDEWEGFSVKRIPQVATA